MSSSDESDSENELEISSDLDDDGNASDRSFESDTDSEPESDYNILSQSTLDSLDSQTSSATDDGFWSENLHDVDVPSFDEDVGPVHGLQSTDSVVKFFFLMFSEVFFQHLAGQTNLYATQLQETKGNDPRWTGTTPAELMAYFGLVILIGINQLPRLRMYWSKKKSIGNQFFKDTMTRNRFQKLSQYFHCNDNRTQAPANSVDYDRLHKIRPLIQMTRGNFITYNRPEKDQSIDEGLIKYKGSYFAKQYMPSKPIKRGLKIWMRCDATSGFCNDFRPYLGKHDTLKGKDLEERVVLHLCRPLKWKAHHVFFDRYFTSVPLVQRLEQNGLFSCGTIKSDRSGYPQELKNMNLTERGDTEQRQHGNMIATVWQDAKPVHFISTCSNPVGDGPTCRRLRGGNHVEIMRPPPVAAYQKYMSGVDRLMQHRAKNHVGRPSKKYWKFFFNFILEVCLINAHIIYEKCLKSASVKPLCLVDFRVAVLEGLVELSTVGTHIPVAVVVHQVEKLNRKRSYCKQCYKNNIRKDTCYGCSKCDLHLCKIPCFQNFHRDNNIQL